MDVGPQDVIPRREYDRLMCRAAAAYLGGNDGSGRWPDEVNSNIERHAKLNYVVLRDEKGKLLAAYRLRREAGGRPAQLKRLLRLPPTLK